MAREAFPGYDEPVNVDMDPEDALRLLLKAEAPPAPNETGDTDEESEDSE